MAEPVKREHKVERRQVISKADGDESGDGALTVQHAFVRQTTATVTQTVSRRKEASDAAAAAAAAPTIAEEELPISSHSALLDMSDVSPEVYSVRFSTNGRILAAGCLDGSVKVINSGSGKVLYSLAKTDVNLPATCVRFRPENAAQKTKNLLIAATADGTIAHWHSTSGRCVHRMQEKGNQVYGVDYRDDSEQFVSGGKDFKLRLYDESTKKLLSTMSGGHGELTAGHSNRVFSVKYHPSDNNIIVSGGWDNTVQFWDTRLGHAVRSIYGPHICGDALDVFEDKVLTGSWRPTEALQMWDFGSGKLIMDFPWKYPPGQRPCLLYTAQFSRDGKKVAAGGSGSAEVRVFDAATGQKLGETLRFAKGVYSVDFSNDGAQLAVGGTSLLQIFSVHDVVGQK